MCFTTGNPGERRFVAFANLSGVNASIRADVSYQCDLTESGFGEKWLPPAYENWFQHTTA